MYNTTPPPPSSSSGKIDEQALLTLHLRSKTPHINISDLNEEQCLALVRGKYEVTTPPLATPPIVTPPSLYHSTSSHTHFSISLPLYKPLYI